VATRQSTLRRGPDVPDENIGKVTAADIGLSRKDIHEARSIRQRIENTRERMNYTRDLYASR
jgi:hypothetical protein